MNIPCKECIVQPICRVLCLDIYKYSVELADRRSQVISIYHPEHEQCRKEYREYKKYFTMIYKRIIKRREP